MKGSLEMQSMGFLVMLVGGTLLLVVLPSVLTVRALVKRWPHADAVERSCHLCSTVFVVLGILAGYQRGFLQYLVPISLIIAVIQTVWVSSLERRRRRRADDDGD